MLFTKVGVYRADQDGSFIVELGHEAEDAVHPIYRSSPLPKDEVWNLLRHVQLSEDEIEQQLQRASLHARASSAG
jgi:hypothetical protein